MATRRRKGHQQKQQAAPAARDFWGTPAAEHAPVSAVRPLQDPTALIKSLGAPPLPGRETIAQYHFELVYQRASALATALAAASNLLALDEDEAAT
jgi:hypothetical protein